MNNIGMNKHGMNKHGIELQNKNSKKQLFQTPLKISINIHIILLYS